MKIEVLTTSGCINCETLQKMLEKLGVRYELIDVTEKPEYLERYPIFTVPSLVINNELKFTGIPKYNELEQIIMKYR